MTFTITEYCDVRDRAKELGLNKPRGLALLPRNFDTASKLDELLHESSVQTLRILFRKNDIRENRVEPEGRKIACIQENEFALVLPTLFVVYDLGIDPHLPGQVRLPWSGVFWSRGLMPLCGGHRRQASWPGRMSKDRPRAACGP